MLTLRTAHGREWQLPADRIQRAYWRASQALWIIGSAHGPCGAVWARAEDEAFDELADAGWSGAFKVEPQDARDCHEPLGNYGDPHDLGDAWIDRIVLDPVTDAALLAHVNADDEEPVVEVTLRVLVYPSRTPTSASDHAWLEEEALAQLRCMREADPASRGAHVTSYRIIESTSEAP